MSQDRPPTKRVHGPRAWRTILTFTAYGAFLGAVVAGGLGDGLAIPILVVIFTVIGVVEGDDIVAKRAAVLFDSVPMGLAHAV